MTPLEIFIEQLKQNKLEEAIALLQQADKQTQIEIVSYIASLVKQSETCLDFSTGPKMLTVLYRTLKPGKNYSDFINAWIPPIPASNQDKKQFSYFDFPGRVVHGENTQDKNKIISIGLIWAPQEQLEAEITRVSSTEVQRHDKIAEVADKIGPTEVYQVADVYDLGAKNNKN